MKKAIILMMVLLLSVSGSASAFVEGESVPQEVMEKISDGSDKLVILEFFASWCHSCKIELPLLVDLHDNLDKSKYTLTGVDIDEEYESGIAFQKMLNLDFKVLNDNKQELVSKFKPRGMPALYYIQNNKVLKVRIGAAAHIDKVILKDLEELKDL